MDIKGYRQLSPNEIVDINDVKAQADKVENLMKYLEQLEYDSRWLAIGKTHLQQGFMALVRAIARPESF
jgi:hypothetical protein